MVKYITYISLIFLLEEITCAKILAVVPVPSYSHQLFFRPIWKELSRRGHQVTLITTDPMPEAPQNIRQIDCSFAYDLRHKKHNITNVVQDNEYNIPKILASYQAMMNDIVDGELSQTEVHQIITDPYQHFDLLMVEYHSPILFALSARFNCPYITMASMEIANYYHKTMGNPVHPVLYPEILLPFERDLKFTERVLSTLYVIWGIIYKKYNYNGKTEEEIVRKHFGDGLPPLVEITRNVSLVLVNAHPVFNVRPLGPGFIRIGGGMHLEQPKPLPKDLQDYLDSGHDGVIYFSLGTNVRRKHLSRELVQIFVETFKELPYMILWKFDADVPEKSYNVKMVPWVPQQDVLRHKNVKLFITQAGIQSVEEAIFGHVPMITIPFVSDQKMNSQKIVSRGLGLTLNKNLLTKDALKRAIWEVIHNSSYTENVRKIADLIQDQPMSGLETAIWWTEYVIRHKGVKHFWHPNVDLPTYQFLLLDVITFLVIVNILILYIVYKLIKFALNLCFMFRNCWNNKIKTN